MIENIKFKIGDRVATRKGCRYNGPSSGEVVGFGTWRHYAATKVKKDSDGSVRLFLTKNLYHTSLVS